VNYDNSLVVTITVTCYLRAPSSGDYLFICGANFQAATAADRWFSYKTFH